MLTNQEVDPTRQNTPERWNPLLRPFVRAWRWLVPASVADRDRQSPVARMMAVGIIVSLSAALLVAAILYAKPIQDSFQSSQAEGMVREARDLMENGQIANAVWKAQEAYTKAPHNAEAVRINAEFFTLMGQQHALYFVDKLKDMGAETLEDKMRRVRALKSLKRDKEADAELERLLRTEPDSLPLAKLAEEVWGKTSKHALALKVLEEVVSKNPNDVENIIRLGRAQVESGIPSNISSAVENVWKIAQKDDTDGLKAIEFLDSVPSMSPDMQRKLIYRLKKHPRANERHYIAAIAREVKLEPDRKRSIISEARTYFQNKKRDQLFPFVFWLKQEQMFLDIINILPESEAMAHQGLLETYLTALTIVGQTDTARFKQIESIIENPAVAKILDPVTHAMFRAHLAFVENKPAEELRAKLIAAKALAQQVSRYDSLQRIAQYADARGHFDIAEDAYRLTIRAARAAATASSPRIERDSFIGLLSASQKNGNSESYFNACRDAIARFPEDSQFLDQYLYGSILLGNDIETSLKKAAKLLQNQPSDNHRHLLVALAYFRLQDQQQATRYLQHMDLNHLTEGQRAVFAAIAAAGGFKEQAIGVIKAISPQAIMFPEERLCYMRAIN